MLPTSLRRHQGTIPQEDLLARQKSSTERKPREAKSRTHALRAFSPPSARLPLKRLRFSLTLHGLLARLRGALEHRDSGLLPLLGLNSPRPCGVIAPAYRSGGVMA